MKMNGSTGPWPDAAVDLVRGGLADNLSCSAIAKRLGENGYPYTRNAVVGIIHRRGFASLRPDAPEKPKPVPKPKLLRKPPPFNGHIKLAFKPKRVSATSAEIQSNPVTLLELEAHHCRWPLGDPQSSDFRFCGGVKQDGSSYCAGHRAMSFRRDVQGNPNFKFERRMGRSATEVLATLAAIDEPLGDAA